MRRRQHREHHLRDFFVSWIRFEYSLIPRTGPFQITTLARDVAEVTEGDEVLGIERQRGLENGTCFVESGQLEQRLAIDDMAAHMPRLLGQIFLTDEDGLLEITRFSVLVGERREVAPRVLIELLTELVDSSRTGH